MKHIGIGGVNFNINSTVSVEIKEDDPYYASFFCKSKEKEGLIDIQVRLELGNLPDTAKFDRVFDSGQAWTMYREGKFFWLVRHPPAFEEPLCAARFSRDSKEIIIYCGKDIVAEKDGKTIVLNPLGYPQGQILLMYILALNKGAVVHSLAIPIGGRVYLFPGASGAGKSTLSRLFTDRAEQPLSVLSDDRTVVRKIGETWKAFGTPWPGEAGAALNESAPLEAVYFLVHGGSNRVRKLDTREAAEKFLQVTSIPWYDREIMPELLFFCEELVNRIPCFELQFVPDAGVVDFLLKRFSY
ncbi:MAG: hypothetical protein KAW12_02705 [Candidatus Aminicenantes bacterium]|nr:hypothetical protein [Candidatus Aminicenantes bacterium]